MIFIRSFLAVAIPLVFASCASVSVDDVERLFPPMPTRVPDKVFVRPFTFTTEKIRVDRSGGDLVQFKSDLRERMTMSLVERLQRLVPHAQGVSETAPLPAGNNWAVAGNFDRINQGSRFLRSLVGLGAGGTKMETTVVVYDLSGHRPRPFLRIRTTGGSNISPGVGGVLTFPIQGPMALTNVVNLVDGVRSGVTFDAIRTSREVTSALSEFLLQQGAIPREKAIGPKRPGRYFNELQVQPAGSGT